MHEREFWAVLGFILMVFSIFTFSTFPETRVDMVISPLSVALTVLSVFGIMTSANGFVCIIVKRL